MELLSNSDSKDRDNLEDKVDRAVRVAGASREAREDKAVGVSKEVREVKAAGEARVDKVVRVAGVSKEVREVKADGNDVNPSI